MAVLGQPFQTRQQQPAITVRQLRQARVTQPVRHAAQDSRQAAQLSCHAVAARTQTHIAQRRRHSFCLQQRLARLGQDILRLRRPGAAQQVDDAACFHGRQRRPAHRAQQRALVAHGQPRQLPRQARCQQAQTQFRLGLVPQPFQERQPPAHPTLVLPQQLGRLHLRQAILAHQSVHDPRLFQGLRPTPRAVESVHGRLGLRFVRLDHAHTQRAPGQRRRRRPPLETIEQLRLPLPHTHHHWRQLPVLPQ